MENSLQLNKPTDATRSLIYSRAEQFAQAWGDENHAQRFMLAAANTINSDETGKLQSCSDSSKMSCLMQLCQWKLMPGKSMGHVFLAPFKGECTIIIGYKGYCELSYRSGLPAWIQSEVVYEKDTFSYELGSESFIKHQKYEGKDRGKRRGVYLIIAFKGQAPKFFDYMTAAEIEPIKAFALKNATGFSPWKGDFEDEMWKKSIIRRDAKRLALGEAVQQAAAYEGEIESLQAQEPALPYPRAAVMENASQLENVEAVIVDIQTEMKKGKKKNEPDYPLYHIITDTGRSFGTFDESVYNAAMNFKDLGETALIEFRQEPYGSKILSISAA